MINQIVIQGKITPMLDTSPFPLYMVTAESVNLPSFITYGAPEMATDTERWWVVQSNTDPRTMEEERFLFYYPEQWILAFKMQKIQGVGWKKAAGILYANKWAAVNKHLAAGAFDQLSEMKGFKTKIGKKVIAEVFKVEEPKGIALDEDAVTGLKVMGYPVTEAKNKVSAVMKADPNLKTDQIIKEALKR